METFCKVLPEITVSQTESWIKPPKETGLKVSLQQAKTKVKVRTETAQG